MKRRTLFGCGMKVKCAGYCPLPKLMAATGLTKWYEGTISEGGSSENRYSVYWNGDRPDSFSRDNIRPRIVRTE